MFEIEYKGANSVVISTKKAKLITDPKLSLAGLRDLSINDSIELLTEERFGVDEKNARLVVHCPGEYGIADFDIKGIPARRHIDTENDGLNCVVYRVEIGESRIAVLGNIDKKLSDDQLESLGVIDILIVPVGGGGYTLDGTDAANLTRSIDPKVVIPVHYADSNLKYEVPQDPLALFVKELGAPVEVVSKYKVKQPLTSQNALQVIEITRS